MRVIFRFTFFLFAVLAVSFAGSAQRAYGQLWEVSGTNQESSYILATVASTDERVGAFNDSVFLLLNQSKSVLSPYYRDSANSWLFDSLSDVPGLLLDKSLSSEEFSAVESAFDETLVGNIWENIHKPPVVLIDALKSAWYKKNQDLIPTYFLMHLAEVEGKELASLYFPADLVALYGSIPFSMQVDMLMGYLEMQPDRKSYMDMYLAYYLRGDMEGLAQWYKEHDQVEHYYQVNREKAAYLGFVLPIQFRQQSTFAMVEAELLGGKNGLIELLERSGYKLKAIPTGLQFNGAIDPMNPYYSLLSTDQESDEQALVYYQLNNIMTDAYLDSIIPTWYPIISYSGGFTARIPEKPVVSVSKSTVPEGELAVYLFKYQNPAFNDFNAVSYSDFPDEFDISRKKDFFNDVVAQAVEQVGGILLVEQDISTAEVMGREIEMAVNENFMVRSRFYFVDNRLYQMMAGADKSRIYNKEVDAFLNSLKLMNQRGSQWPMLDINGVKVNMPAIPRRRTDVMAQIENIQHYSYDFFDGKTSLEYTAAFNPLNMPVKYSVVDKMMNAMVYGSVNDLNGILINEQKLVLNGYPARSLEIGVNNGKTYRIIYLYCKQKIYQFMVSGPEDSIYSDLADRFLESISFAEFLQ